MTYTKKRVSNLKKRNMSRKKKTSMRSKTRKVGQHSRKTKRTLKGGFSLDINSVLYNMRTKLLNEKKSKQFKKKLDELYKKMENLQIDGNNLTSSPKKSHGEVCDAKTGNKNKGFIVFIPRLKEDEKTILYSEGIGRATNHNFESYGEILNDMPEKKAKFGTKYTEMNNHIENIKKRCGEEIIAALKNKGKGFDINNYFKICKKNFPFSSTTVTDNQKKKCKNQRCFHRIATKDFLMYETKIQAAIYGTFKEQIDIDIANKMEEAQEEAQEQAQNEKRDNERERELLIKALKGRLRNPIVYPKITNKYRDQHGTKTVNSLTNNELQEMLNYSKAHNRSAKEVKARRAK